MCRLRISIIVLFTGSILLCAACGDPAVSTPHDSAPGAEYSFDSTAERQNADSIAMEHSRPLAVNPPKEQGIRFDKHDTHYPCQIENPDTSIHNVILCDINSSLSVLGNHWELIEDNIDMPHQNFSNAHGTQFLRCFFHYGDGRYAYSEFEVSYLCNEPKMEALSDAEFISGNNIRLGMPRDSVVAAIGNCYLSDTVNHNPVLRYIADDFLHNAFLQHWNYPKYYAHYEFKEEKLIRFRFGFEYP
jgi:hypothetical protein